MALRIYTLFYFCIKQQPMTAITLQSRNPFNKSNPFYVPQKFYSQDHLSSYPLRNNLFTHNSQNHKIPAKNLSHNQINHYQTPSHQRKDKDHTLATLKKRNIREMQNPFFRKNLIPTAGDNLPTGIQTINISSNELQLKHQRLFYSRKKGIQTQEEKEIYCFNTQNPIINQLPSMKQFTEEKPRYLSSQLALKLKSQTCLENNMGSPFSKCDTNKIPVSLGKSQSRITQSQCLRIPQTIFVRGKIYYNQNIVSIY